MEETQRPCKYAYAFKIEGVAAAVHRDARFLAGDCIELLAEKAVFEGGHLILEQFSGQRESIGGWNDPSARVHWLAYIAEPGTYTVRGRFAAVSPTALALDVSGQTVQLKVPKTGGWADSKNFDLGRITFDESGVHHFILRPVDPKNWKPVNIWKLEMAPLD